MKFYVRGGIGDFLQNCWFVCNNKTREFIIHTHFKEAESFFKNLNIENTSFYYFNTMEEHDSEVDNILGNHGENSTTNIRDCPRCFYSDIDFSQESKDQAKAFSGRFTNNKPIIGIHPFGSNFSSDTYSRFNLPPKHIPAEVVSQIINEDYNYIIFGSKSQLESYGVKESGNVLHTDMGIESCLELVKHCAKFLGTDSCFKTMSAMVRVPTYCVLGDFEDGLRDKFFIDQYEKDDVMKVFRFKDMEKEKGALIEFLKTKML